MKKYIDWEVENLKMTFQLLFFELYDILLNNIFRSTKFAMLIDNIQLEGTVSQIFEIGLSLYFMKCRKFNQKKSTKSSRFFS